MVFIGESSPNGWTIQVSEILSFAQIFFQVESITESCRHHSNHSHDWQMCYNFTSFHAFSHQESLTNLIFCAPSLQKTDICSHKFHSFPIVSHIFSLEFPRKSHPNSSHPPGPSQALPSSSLRLNAFHLGAFVAGTGAGSGAWREASAAMELLRSRTDVLLPIGESPTALQLWPFISYNWL